MDRADVAAPSSRRARVGVTTSNRPAPTLSVAARTGLTATRGVRNDVAPARRDVFAAIDLGSSSAKLLVVKRTPTGFVTLLDRKIGCALGKGVQPGQDIPDANQRRALDAIATFVDDAARLGVAACDLPVITTAVVRNAPHGELFAQRVRDALCVDVRVLSGTQEADVGYRGALGALLHAPGRYATLDLGGGSFQLAVGDELGMHDGGSTQVGSNAVLDRMIAPHARADGSFDGARLFDEIDHALARDAPMPLPPAQLQGRTLVATGGVSKFLRAHFGRDVVTRDEIDALRRALAPLADDARVATVQLGKDDATRTALGVETLQGAIDYGRKLPASCTLLLHILRGLDVDAVCVSETDARHALVLAAAT